MLIFQFANCQLTSGSGKRSHDFCQILSYTLAHVITCSHMFSHVLTCSHMFSHVLTCSHMLSHYCSFNLNYPLVNVYITRWNITISNGHFPLRKVQQSLPEDTSHKIPFHHHFPMVFLWVHHRSEWWFPWFSQITREASVLVVGAGYQAVQWACELGSPAVNDPRMQSLAWPSRNWRFIGQSMVS